MQVNPVSVARAKVIYDHGTPAQVEAMERGKLPLRPTAEKRLASAQVQLLRTHDPEVAAAGDLVIVELKPQGMIVGNLGPL